MNGEEIVKTTTDIIPKFARFFEGMSEKEMLEYDERIKQQELEQEKRCRLNAFKSCGIGELYYDVDLRNFKTDYPMQETMLNMARMFYKKVRNGDITNLVLLGGAGRGKTTLAIGLLKQFCMTVKKVVEGINQYYTVCYITSKDLCDLFSKTKSFTYGKSWDKLINDFTFYDILVIDEVGKATDKNEFEILFSILDKRMQNKKSNIWLSNLEYCDFMSQMSDYGVSRLNYHGNLLLKTIEGIPDLRQNTID